MRTSSLLSHQNSAEKSWTNDDQLNYDAQAASKPPDNEPETDGRKLPTTRWNDSSNSAAKTEFHIWKVDRAFGLEKQSKQR
jgi:hypothetical protein